MVKAACFVRAALAGGAKRRALTNLLRSVQSRWEKWERASPDLRPELDKVFVAHREAPPSTFREAIIRLQGKGSLIWSMGKLLYDRAAETDASEATIKEFRRSVHRSVP